MEVRLQQIPPREVQPQRTPSLSRNQSVPPPNRLLKFLLQLTKMPPLLLRNIFNYFLDIILPKFCVGCGKEGLYICKDCEIFLSEMDTANDVSDVVNRSHVVSVWEYEGLMEKLIYKIKFDG